MTQPPEGPRSHLRPVAPGEVVASDAEFDDLPAVMWNLSGAIADAALSELHTHLVANMRREARHLPTSTLQAMQLERIASLYVTIRAAEATQWRSPRERDATYKLWRDLSSDFSAAVMGNKISPDQLNQIVQSNTARLVAQVLSGLPPAEAKPLYRVFSDALAESG